MKPYYSDDAVTIYHGDCRDILPSLPKVDLCLTDPPYGVNLEYKEGYVDSRVGYNKLIGDVFRAMLSLTPRIALTPGIRNLWIYPPADWILCWTKPGTMGRSDLGGFNAWEPILMYGKRRIWQDLFHAVPGTALGSAFKDGEGHPCPKPVALFRWLAEQLSDCGETILDPFMGSGTTLRAAKDLGRKAIGIEIEERYCEIAAKRMSQSVMAL